MFCICPSTLNRGEKLVPNLSYFALVLSDLLTFGDFKLLALELHCEDDSLVLPNVCWFVLPCEVSPSEASNLMDFHFLLHIIGLSPTESDISNILVFSSVSAFIGLVKLLVKKILMMKFPCGKYFPYSFQFFHYHIYSTLAMSSPHFLSPFVLICCLLLSPCHSQ